MAHDDPAANLPPAQPATQPPAQSPAQTPAQTPAQSTGHSLDHSPAQPPAQPPDLPAGSPPGSPPAQPPDLPPPDDTGPAALRLRLPVSPGTDAADTAANAGSRGAAADAGAASQLRLTAALLPQLQVLQTWSLGAAQRATAGGGVTLPVQQQLLALETDDGSTLFIRADALAEQLQRARPELLDADGTLDLARLVVPERGQDAQRGSAGAPAGQWPWRRVSELRLLPDDITARARQAALEWLLAKGLDSALAEVPLIGARMLMEAIESQLAGPPGLYQWDGGALRAEQRCADARDPRLAALGGPQGKPALVFVHGTGSHTLGSFGELPGSAHWAALVQAFEGRVFGFEHRSFSESPVSNAMTLLDQLPDGARLCLVSHSRGGLVGDLLCLASEGAEAHDFDALVAQYRRKPRADEQDAEARDPRLATLREQLADDEQAQLRALLARLRAKRIRVERYVRVACPARGTALLSDNLDVFLSGLLTLVRKLGAWLAGAVVGVLAPPAAAAAKLAAEQGLKLLSRLVLEIADKRFAPQVVPGIEAMLPDAPLGTLLALAQPQPALQMAVVAGDIEGGGLFKRLALMFTDWMLFDRERNDLVVNTASMYAGLARRAQARAIFVRGAEVNHFVYFRDATRSGRLPLPQALLRWCTEAQPQALPEWQPLSLPAAPAIARGSLAGPAQPEGLVLLLPGIMGSHLAQQRDRIWLDPLDLARGRLRRLRMPEPAQPDGVLELAYGALVRHLGASHRVELHPYDWRQPLLTSGALLANRLEQLLQQQPALPLHIVAHSMGGLVWRAALAQAPTLWPRIVARGGRLLMLGTPNQGSHLMVETLLGQAGTVRMLAAGDLVNSLQQVLDIVAGFDGALQLLPAPGFADSAGSAALSDSYYQRSTWEGLQRIHHDFWFGRRLCGLPSAQGLQAARDFWQRVADTGWLRAHPEHVAYVHGKADNTPCGLRLQRDARGRDNGVLVLGTARGDGSVSWASGQLADLPEQRQWLMPADHMGLAATPAHFDDILSLLRRGSPLRLGRLPASRAGIDSADATTATPRRPAPPQAPASADELIARLLGSQQPPLPLALQRPAARQSLRVEVKAMDVRFANMPVLCGHFQGDAIAGAEALIDSCLTGGALSRRHRLGLHAGEPGSASVVLQPRSADELRQGLGRGAVVVGLGPMGRLSAEQVTQAVRAGVLRLLMHAEDRDIVGQDAEPGGRSAGDGSRDGGSSGGSGGTTSSRRLQLAALLVGSNSAAQLGIDDAVRAVTLGVLQANHDLAAATPGADAPRELAAPVQIGRLVLVELFRDHAIRAADTVAQLDTLLRAELSTLGAELDVAQELSYGDGVRERLDGQPGPEHWPRLEVSDADRDEADCSDGCWDIRLRHQIPPETLRRILTLWGRADASAAGTATPGWPDGQTLPPPTALDVPPAPRLAQRLRYVYMGERALAPVLQQSQQPGLADKLLAQMLAREDRTVWRRDDGLGTSLFNLMLPIEIKALWRRSAQLVLVLDSATAALPWELMEDAGQPLALRKPLLRQLRSPRQRRHSSAAGGSDALLVAQPDTRGFRSAFGLPVDAAHPDRLGALPGAVREADAVQATLAQAGLTVYRSPTDAAAHQVYGQLFARPYRVLALAAHGVHQQRAADGSWRSGVVLSDGLLLSAAEIGLMERVPELVFLSCCNVGAIGNEAPQRLAYSLARELIEMGVRCVVAAGWEVNDAAAECFARTFFAQLAGQPGANFAQAVTAARQACHAQHGGHNTWAAYQAWGDPQYRLQPAGNAHAAPPRPLRAPEALVQWLEQQRLNLHAPAQSGAGAASPAELRQRVEDQLAAQPPGWRQRADVLLGQARLEAELGPEGWDAACQLALAALRASGSPPLSAVELLANCEARSADQLGQSGDPHALALALQRCQQAVRRLQHLLALQADAAEAAEAAFNPPSAALAERYSLLGSALKIQAVLLAKAKARADADHAAEPAPLLSALQQAIAAYRQAEQHAPDGSYARLNRLQLQAVLPLPAPPASATPVAHANANANASATATATATTPAPATTTATASATPPVPDDDAAMHRDIDAARAAARAQMADTHEPWAFLGLADAELTDWLLALRRRWAATATPSTATPSTASATRAAPDPAIAAPDALLQAYRRGLQRVGLSPRQRDSVFKQLRVLALLLRALGDDPRANALDALREALTADRPATPTAADDGGW